MANIPGTPGNDTLNGTAQADRINGAGGNDVLRGRGGNDVLDGGNGADQLIGQAGRDVLRGGAGDDTLDGGPGPDALNGGPGSDTFVISNVRHGVDTIAGFVEGTDRFNLRDALPNFEAGDDLGDFVRFTAGPQGTTLALNPTGTGGTFTNVASLRGVQIDGLSAGELGLPVQVEPPPGITVASSTAAGAVQDDWRSPGAVRLDKSISDEGTIVAFESEAGNLAGGGAGSDVFAKDLETGEIQLASANGNGVAANGISFDPVVSGNGRYVAFASEATNLVARDTNGDIDVFRKDLDTGEVVRATVSARGVQGNNGGGQFGGLAVSDDGNSVAFISNSTNLLPRDTNGLADVFVKNLTTGEIVRANTTADGDQQTEGIPLEVAISGDGSTVAFSTDASLLPADADDGFDVYVKDLNTGTLTLASTGSGEGDSGTVSLSDDGRFVAFQSTSTDLVPDDTNDARDVFVRDLQTGDIVLASTSSDGVQYEPGGGAAASMAPVISGDGRVVVFQTDANNLVGDDNNNVFDVFAKNLVNGELVRVSVTEDGTEGTSASGWPAVTDDGRQVAFESSAPELVGGEVGGVNQVLVAPVIFFDDGDDGGPTADDGDGGPTAGTGSGALRVGDVLDADDGIDALGPSGAPAAPAAAAVHAADLGPAAADLDNLIAAAPAG